MTRLATTGGGSTDGDASVASPAAAAAAASPSPYFWSGLRRRGYATLMLQGLCQDWGLTYTGADTGDLDHDIYAPFCHPEYHPHPRTYGNFQGPFSIRRRCIGGRYVHDYMFDYLRQFNGNYADLGRVAVALFMEGHEGTMEVVRTLDDDLAHFIEHDVDLENTLVLLTADHGNHMGPYPVFTQMGKLELALPALFVLAPQRLLRCHPSIRAALERNQQRLTTPLDVYFALRSLEALPEFGAGGGGGSGGASCGAGGAHTAPFSADAGIFGPIAPNRTCAEAHIDGAICSCGRIPSTCGGC